MRCRRRRWHAATAMNLSGAFAAMPRHVPPGFALAGAAIANAATPAARNSLVIEILL
jgi:hypothetical protein